jgi:hypothetical protein
MFSAIVFAFLLEKLSAFSLQLSAIFSAASLRHTACPFLEQAES